MSVKRQNAGDDLLTIEVRDGTQICVPGVLDRMATYVLLEQEDWFEDEVDFVRQYVRPRMNIVDIGANYGSYALSVARYAGEHGKVWAVESGQSAAAYLR